MLANGLRITITSAVTKWLGTTSLRKSNQKRESWVRTRPFVRDAGRQHVIESGDAIGRNEEQVVTVQVVDVAHLPLAKKFEIGIVGLKRTGSRMSGLI